MAQESSQVNNEELPREIIPLKVKVSFGLGAMATAILMGLPSAFLTFYYVEKLGAEPGLIGIAWLIFGIWNVINDPIASFIIDNTRTKIGRRIPYIRYGAPIFGLAFIFCWFPLWTTQIGLFFNFILVLFLLDTCFTVIGCCFFCLPNEIALTAQGRAELTIFSALFGSISVGLSFLVPVIFLIGQNGIHPFFLPFMVILGIACSVILFISSYGIKENMFAQMQEYEPFFEGLKLTLKNKAFWIYMLPAFCIALLLPILQLGILYYMDYVIIGQDALLLFLFLLGGIILGFMINVAYVGKFGPKYMLIFDLSIVALGFGLLFFLGYNVYGALFPGLLIGIGLAGLMVSGGVVMGDIIDNDEYITGKRREAIYGGVNAIVTKYPISLANWLFLFVIVAFGFIPPIEKNGISIKQPQSDMAIYGIMVAFCLIPALLLALSALLMKWYPLHGPEWNKKKKFIIDLHEQKEREWVKNLAEEGKLNR